MTVKFTCQACGLKKHPVEIVARGDKESLASWMKLVKRVVGMAHQRLSPNCHSDKVDLMIPVSEDSVRVGSE